MSRMDDLRETVASLPAQPGVYIFKDAAGKVIYVGKAKSLRARVASYFRDQGQEAERAGRITRHAAALDFILTSNELEALLLESTLIKKHQPRCNVLLRDDKGYPFLKLTREDFPKLEFTHRMADDGARYFGPYSSGASVRGTLRFLKRVFPIRHCATMKKQPCMYHHIEKCPGPCSGNVSVEEYAEAIKAATLFLEGRAGRAIAEMRREMEAAASEMKFEKAAILRDRIAALEKVSGERQTVVLMDGGDRDVIALAKSETLACVETMFIRDGLMTGHEPFILKAQPEQTEEEIMEAFIKQYYIGGAPPPELLISVQVEDRELLEEFLRGRAGRKVALRKPVRGEKKSLVETALKNSRQRLEDEEKKQSVSMEERRKLTRTLTWRLGAKKPARRIVGFDISTIQGTNTVGAAVVFQDARPEKESYRRFIIKGSGKDDFSSMREMARRYFTRVAEGRELPPDLVIVDGGKGQVSAFAAGLSDAGVIQPVRAIGYAKKTGVSHLLNEDTPIIFAPDDESARLVRMVVAETHRFAVSFHRERRGKEMLES